MNCRHLWRQVQRLFIAGDHSLWGGAMLVCCWHLKNKKPRASKEAQNTSTNFLTSRMNSCGPVTVSCSDLVNTEVCHSENKRAGHEVGLWRLRRRRTERSGGGGGVYFTWRGKRRHERIRSKQKIEKFEDNLCIWKLESLEKEVCITAPSCAHTHITHTVVPASRHQQHWGGCVCELRSRSPPSAPLSPTSPSAFSWLPRGSYTSSLKDTGG